MSLGSRDAQAVGLLNRFGFGPRAGDVAALGDPLEAMRQLVRLRAVAQPTGDLLTTSRALTELDEFRTDQQRRRAAQVAADQAKQDAAMGGMSPPGMSSPGMSSPAMGAPATGQPPAPGQAAAPPRLPTPAQIAAARPQAIFRNEVEARFNAAIAAQTGFAERLVWFWSNHFCVAVAKGQPLRVTAGSFEREAIRPHVFGRFADMLIAVEKHPAMLIYLDNRQSIGPASRAGARRGRGLNENLAREILELHTLGAGGGYAQADVTNLAKIITGWTVIGTFDEDGELGEFRFNGNRHEPGEIPLLGRAYPNEGVRQGERALADIARHPSTAQHVALKLARHFIADEPPPALVARLAQVFRASDGDLATLSLALLDSAEAREAPPTKLRTPQEFIVAALRATGRRFDPGQALNASNAMGQPIWNPSGPNGFPDIADHWANPEGMKVRLDFAATIARQTPPGPNPNEILDATIGPIASAETREAVARAESRAQGIALALMSPEFQRR
jgi:uncharacterized protein (DUF1800 family)